MTLREFIERTGFDPTAEEFNKIAESYYHFDGDAEAFCKDFVENHRDRDYYVARADEIAKLKGQILELDKQFKNECERYERELARQRIPSVSSDSGEITYSDINREFTAAAAEYLSKGYSINTGTMDGSQGEVAHIDLTDGKEIIRVLLTYDFIPWPEKEYTIIVGRVPSVTTPNLRTHDAETIWNNELEIISSVTYTERETGPMQYEYKRV